MPWALLGLRSCGSGALARGFLDISALLLAAANLRSVSVIGPHRALISLFQRRQTCSVRIWDSEPKEFPDASPAAEGFCFHPSPPQQKFCLPFRKLEDFLSSFGFGITGYCSSSSSGGRNGSSPVPRGRVCCFCCLGVGFGACAPTAATRGGSLQSPSWSLSSLRRKSSGGVLWKSACERM